MKIGERGTLGIKVHFFHPLGIQQQQSIVEIFLHIYLLLWKALTLPLPRGGGGGGG